MLKKRSDIELLGATLLSLSESLDQAGGSLSVKDLKSMSAWDFLVLIGPNGISFKCDRIVK